MTARKPAKPKSTFEERDVTTIRHETTKQGETELRLVRWIVDGKDTGLKLEKRRSWIKDGKKMSGKLVGFSRADWDYLWANREEIEVAFR